MMILPNYKLLLRFEALYSSTQYFICHLNFYYILTIMYTMVHCSVYYFKTKVEYQNILKNFRFENHRIIIQKGHNFFHIIFFSETLRTFVTKYMCSYRDVILPVILVILRNINQKYNTNLTMYKITGNITITI